MRVAQIACYRFKNHSETAVPLQGRTAVCGPNGSGKTNFLEAAYFALNGALPPGKRATELASGFEGAFFVRAKLENEAGLPYEFRISCDTEKKSVSFAIQGENVSRAAYLAKMPVRAMLFSPIEMNVLYLGPSLRRDFLDEPVSLAFPEFAKLKKDYSSALKNRNALLKKIAEGEAKSADLSVWDPLFTAKAAEYFRYRMRFVDYVRERSDRLSSLLDGKYDVRFGYDSKTDPRDPEGSIAAYLLKNRERDVVLGHTYVGPHLDDFRLTVALPSGEVRSEDYLSRGENKSLLYALKLIAADFLEEKGGKPIFLLFDDLFSELDPHRSDLVLQRAADRSFVIAGQKIPESVRNAFDMGFYEF